MLGPYMHMLQLQGIMIVQTSPLQNDAASIPLLIPKLALGSH